MNEVMKTVKGEERIDRNVKRRRESGELHHEVKSKANRNECNVR